MSSVLLRSTVNVSRRHRVLDRRDVVPMINYSSDPILHEEDVWRQIDTADLWLLDKLILSRHLGYECGPAGVSVRKPDEYVVRPCVNALGMGLGCSIEFLSDSTDHLPPGTFWCERFEGRHLSIDYVDGYLMMCVEGIKKDQHSNRWDRWFVSNEHIELPEILRDASNKYRFVNCEFVGGHLIECHFRLNSDFRYNNSVFVPVYTGESTDPPEGFRFVPCPEVDGRIGAFIK